MWWTEKNIRYRILWGLHLEMEMFKKLREYLSEIEGKVKVSV